MRHILEFNSFQDFSWNDRSNAEFLSTEQKMILIFWGAKLYGWYPYLSNEEGCFPTILSKRFSNIEDIIEKYETDDTFLDWLENIWDGTYKENGKKCITQPYVDRILESITIPSPQKLTLYRSERPDDMEDENKWVSTSLDPSLEYSGDRYKIEIEEGDPIIPTYGYCDNSEIILSSEFWNSKKTPNEL